MPDKTDKAPSKEEAVKASAKKWVDEAGAAEIFKSANVNRDQSILAVPVTHFDISDRNFG